MSMNNFPRVFLNNKEEKEIYQLTEKPKKIFIKFKEEIINKFIIPNVNKDIDYLESIESNFCDCLLDFAITNKINEDKISDFDEQKISFCDKFNSEFKDIELILKRYFETPFSERFKDEIKEKDYESIIELIYIYIGVFNNNPETVAKAYKTAIDVFPKYFDEIEFAIYCRDDKTNYQEFLKVFG